MFTDDVQGLGEEHPNAAPSMGLTNEQVVVLQEATQVAYNQMLAALRDVNGYNWQVCMYAHDCLITLHIRRLGIKMVSRPLSHREIVHRSWRYKA